MDDEIDDLIKLQAGEFGLTDELSLTKLRAKFFNRDFFDQINELFINNMCIQEKNLEFYPCQESDSEESDSFENPFENPENYTVNICDKVPVILSKKALRGLREIKYKTVCQRVKTLTPEEACPICFSKLSENQTNFKYIILPCSHIYHADCIREHLTNYDYHCPVCRCEVGESIPKI